MAIHDDNWTKEFEQFVPTFNTTNVVISVLCVVVFLGLAVYCFWPA